MIIRITFNLKDDVADLVAKVRQIKDASWNEVTHVAVREE